MDPLRSSFTDEPIAANERIGHPVQKIHAAGSERLLGLVQSLPQIASARAKAIIIPDTLMKYTQIIILNWNAGADTWKCLQRVLPLDAVRIAVLDNGSSDDSVSLLQRNFKETGIGFLELNASEISNLSISDSRVSLIKSSENLGFARGVNRIVHPLLRRDDVEFIWLLNNDALAESESLNALKAALMRDPGLGFAGSAIMDGVNQDEVQCFGVKYFKWFGVAKMQFKGRSWSSIGDAEFAAARSDFQHGASLLVRMETIRKVGLMDEDFFLYSEEHDWQQRALEAGFRNAPVRGSRVFHLGSMSTAGNRFLFFYYYCKSSVLYSRKHHPGLVAGMASLLLFLITVLRTRINMKSLRWALKGMTEAWRKQL